MYHRKYACKNNSSIIEKKRTFVLPVSIAWTALCAVLIVLTLLGKNHTPFSGTGAYFNDTESAAVQFQIDFRRGCGLTGQQAVAGDGTSQASSTGSSPSESASSTSSAASAESSGASSESSAASSQVKSQTGSQTGASAVESSSAESSQAENSQPADSRVQSAKESEEP